ncbi:MAG: hypothetical protein QGF29_04555 [Verrucomicrobiota bacterium]|jgi:hypothetical protein|nr:hypothetical protein [Verrucomicrobiota bacterium]MDP6914358.1 hypothetical protein [Verrucomicrobiota bacterium]
MDIQVAVLCDAATDYKGKLNLLGTFNSVHARELPANYPQCSIVLRVVFKVVEEGSHKLRINFVDEDGKFVMPSIELPFEVNVAENDSFAYRNFILNIQRLKFEKFGQHAVDIAIDGRQEASIPLEVKQIPGQGKEDADS